MTETDPQAPVEWEDLPASISQWATVTLAHVSRWAMAPLVMPLLTSLSFAASTAFLCLIMPPGFFSLLLSWPWFLMPCACLILGFGLGNLLRGVLIRIGDKKQPKTDKWVLVGTGLAWILAFLVQIYLYDLWTV